MMGNDDGIICKTCGSAPCHPECAAASEPALSDLLRWTANEPTETGYYWFKATDLDSAVIVDVFNYNGDIRFMVGSLRPGVGVGMVGKGARWSDKPIKRPIET